MAKELAFGLSGFTELDSGGTATATDAFVAVQAVNGDATFSGTTYQGDNQTSMTLPDGAITYGCFTQVTVTAGRVKCYKNVENNFNALKARS